MQEISIREQNALLRRAQLEKRAALSCKERAALDVALVREIARHPAFLCADALLLYAPVRGEPDLLPLFEIARERGLSCGFPRCVGKEMTFHAVSDLAQLQEGRFGIPTPSESAPSITPTKQTLCILPALAATRDGRRLGYGGGFYDRYLACFPAYALLGIYQILLTDDIPTEPTDRTANAVITEKGVLWNA